MRSIALAGFIGSALMLRLLLRRHTNDRVAFVAAIVFLLSPTALLYGRAALIEYPATFCALAFVFAAFEWDRTRRGRWLLIGLVAGGAVSLIKFTTAIFWIAPVVVLRRVTLVVVAITAGLTGYLWTIHADALKNANTNTAWLTSNALMEWNFEGTGSILEYGSTS